MQIAEAHHNIVKELIVRGAKSHIHAIGGDIIDAANNIASVSDNKNEMLRRHSFGIGPDTLEAFGWFASGTARMAAATVRNTIRGII